MFPILFKLISFVPWFLLVGISRVLAYMFMLLNSSQYKVTKNNINHCFGGDKAIINKSFLRTTELLFEYPYVWGNPENYKNLVEKDSMAYKFFDEKKPKIVFSMHMGCVDVMLFLIS